MKTTTYIYTFIGMVMLLILAGCERTFDSEGVSRVTTYPEFNFNGDEVLFVEKGSDFQEPGVSATENGEEIPVVTSVTGTYFVGNAGSTLDTSVPDIYTINYAATNSDGFDGVVSRTVFVVAQGDLVTSLEGLYTSTVVRDGASGAQYTDMEYVFINKTGENTYEISDGIGGYYDIGRAYGPTYAAQPATFTANDIPSNDFTFGPAFGVGLFGGVAEITSMQVNAANKTIKFTTEWDSPFTFEVTLKQVQF